MGTADDLPRMVPKCSTNSRSSANSRTSTNSRSSWHASKEKQLQKVLAKMQAATPPMAPRAGQEAGCGPTQEAGCGPKKQATEFMTMWEPTAEEVLNDPTCATRE